MQFRGGSRESSSLSQLTFLLAMYTLSGEYLGLRPIGTVLQVCSDGVTPIISAYRRSNACDWGGVHAWSTFRVGCGILSSRKDEALVIIE